MGAVFALLWFGVLAYSVKGHLGVAYTHRGRLVGFCRLLADGADSADDERAAAAALD